ncbi:MAG TPA: Gfo/Idh/MocA family oxidoreductase [Candidatus Polarisedimenticolaceae bacterium]
MNEAGNGGGNRKLRFGLVGCGRIGSRHAEQIAKNPRAELTVACDVEGDRARAVAERFGGRATERFEDALGPEVDIVSVCTPSGLHAAMSIAALGGGKHVLCEKPMTMSVADAEAVVEAERRSGKRFLLVKQNRYNPPIRFLKDLAWHKRLGQITLINCNVIWNRRKSYYDESPWRGTMHLDGGALMTQCSHFLDLMIWIGGAVHSVSAIMANLTHPYVETEDAGFVTLRFRSGALGSLQYTTNAYEKNIEGSMTILGTEGSVKVGGEYLNTLEFCNVRDLESPTLEPGNPANDYGSYKGSMSNHDKVIENAVEVLLDAKEIAVNSVQGLESIEALQAAYVSAIERREVKLPLSGADRAFRLDRQPPLSGAKRRL